MLNLINKFVVSVKEEFHHLCFLASHFWEAFLLKMIRK